jgi:ubiquinone/menaquinone biosynthesis C-methylase UbiE
MKMIGERHLSRLEESIGEWPVNGMPLTLGARTRRVYDRLAAIYPISSVLFHSRAHLCALEASGVRDGMNVLEVATGSGEMFRRLVRANGSGATVGVDLSPKMAAHTLRAARRRFPTARAHCQAADARRMAFRDETFDALFCCYMLELLSVDDVVGALWEFRRVLHESGHLTLVLISQNNPVFNALYRVAGKAAPALWGRQVERRMAELLEIARFEILQDRTVFQSWFPSRVLVVRKCSRNAAVKGRADLAPASHRVSIRESSP